MTDAEQLQMVADYYKRHQWLIGRGRNRRWMWQLFIWEAGFHP